MKTNAGKLGDILRKTFISRSSIITYKKLFEKLIPLKAPHSNERKKKYHRIYSTEFRPKSKLIPNTHFVAVIPSILLI